MKKLFTLAVALMLLVSCNGKSNALKTLDDTVSVKFGEMYGYGVRDELSKMNPDLNYDEYLKGIAMVVNIDSANLSLIQGIQFGLNIQQMARRMNEVEKVNFDKDLFFKAFKEAFTADSILDPQMLQMEVMPLLRQASAANKANDPAIKANKEAGEKYIAERVAEGAVTTASGLAYKVITEGDGKCFVSTDKINVKYEGRHINGEVFDSSNGESVVFTPMQVVPGFREALMLMSAGAKFEIYIPGNLAYGDEGRDPVIGPNETLVFTVETLGVSAE